MTWQFQKNLIIEIMCTVGQSVIRFIVHLESCPIEILSQQQRESSKNTSSTKHKKARERAEVGKGTVIRVAKIAIVMLYRKPWTVRVVLLRHDLRKSSRRLCKFRSRGRAECLLFGWKRVSSGIYPRYSFCYQFMTRQAKTTKATTPPIATQT